MKQGENASDIVKSLEGVSAINLGDTDGNHSLCLQEVKVSVSTEMRCFLTYRAPRNGSPLHVSGSEVASMSGVR